MPSKRRDPLETYVGGQPADATCYSQPFSMALRRRKDGYTRVEITVHAVTDCIVSGHEETYKGYLTDDERRNIAAMFLHGLETNDGHDASVRDDGRSDPAEP